MAADRDLDWLLPPDIERLRTLERWSLVLLSLIRERIAEIECRDRVTEAARGGPVVTPLTEWKLEMPIGIGRHSGVLVHTADCRLASGRTRPATREQVLDALRQPQVEACSICPAARELGVTDS
ncbi:hypothetical protein SUDANB120_06224 (plasmid) [Streptomyces sp. enrichment culture]|uniref:DUF6233 domain-containing protein n=1 Tax=Streptomyces sp. enrichment culture TaxID=1795815 RepID=UPI003F54C1EB